MSSSVEPGEVNSEIISLTAAVTKIDSIKITSKLLTKHLRISGLNIAQKNLGYMNECVSLFSNCLN